ncbi:MAG: hypothetical protein OXC26_09205 [Albidovulum sp.]|nr:hypothetical protein [Albidovulum sp.]
MQSSINGFRCLTGYDSQRGHGCLARQDRSPRSSNASNTASVRDVAPAMAGSLAEGRAHAGMAATAPLAERIRHPGEPDRHEGGPMDVDR